MKKAQLLLFLLLALAFVTSSVWIPHVSDNAVLRFLFVSPFGMCLMMLLLVATSRLTAAKNAEN